MWFVIHTEKDKTNDNEWHIFLGLIISTNFVPL